MGRPQLGKAKRSEVIHVRVTEAERKELEKAFGKAGVGLHALMTAWLRRGK